MFESWKTQIYASYFFYLIFKKIHILFWETLQKKVYAYKKLPYGNSNIKSHTLHFIN